MSCKVARRGSLAAFGALQVALFANARAVVGYHGAGFANTMLSTHGARVVA